MTDELPDGVVRDHPLARLTTIRTGGNAELFARPGTIPELERLPELGGRGEAGGRGRGVGVEPVGGGRGRPRIGAQT